MKASYKPSYLYLTVFALIFCLGVVMLICVSKVTTLQSHPTASNALYYSGVACIVIGALGVFGALAHLDNMNSRAEVTPLHTQLVSNQPK